MSIIWADFPSGQQGIYGTDETKMMNGIYATSAGTLVEDPDPNTTGVVLLFNSSATRRFVLPGGAVNGGGVAFRLWLPNLPTTGTTQLMSFGDSGSQTQVSLGVDSTGKLHLYRGNIGGAPVGALLASTAAPVITANAWNHIEIKLGVISDSIGEAETRVNGVTKINVSGVDTKQNATETTFSVITLGAPYQTFVGYIKDLIIWDTNGTENNDFQGSVTVRDLYLNGDFSLNWTPSAGTTGWDLIDETTPNDSDYIQAGDPAPSPYVGTLTNLPEDVTTVRALLPIVRTSKTDGGDCNIQVGLTPNNIDWDNGADRPLTTAYTYFWDVSEVSPDTLLPWTPIEVNAAYVRANRTL